MNSLVNPCDFKIKIKETITNINLRGNGIYSKGLCLKIFKDINTLMKYAGALYRVWIKKERKSYSRFCWWEKKSWLRFSWLHILIIGFEALKGKSKFN